MTCQPKTFAEVILIKIVQKVIGVRGSGFIVMGLRRHVTEGKAEINIK